MNQNEILEVTLNDEEELNLVSPSGLLPPVYFPVSLLKLVVMSVCTFGIYELFWFYKNWCLIKERQKLNIKPAWRMFFSYFFCYSCLKRIRMTAESLNMKESLHVGVLTAGWVLVSLFVYLPDPYWLLGNLAVLFLIPVQRLVNRINAAAGLKGQANNRLTGWNITAVIVGGILILIILIGNFLLPEE